MKHLFKKTIVIVLCLIILITMFVGCTNTRLDALEKSLSELEIRLSKVEKSVVAIEELLMLGDDEEVKDLITTINNIQSQLLNNSINDAALKKQVTEMQAKLDKIAIDSEEVINLTKTQELLNMLYGQVNQTNYKMGDKIQAQLNGIIYYEVVIYGEFHDGHVNKENSDKLFKCGTSEKHWCGNMTFTNHMKTTLKAFELEDRFRITEGHVTSHITLLNATPGPGFGQILKDTKPGETVFVFWRINYIPIDNAIDKNPIAFDMEFNIGEFPMRDDHLARLRVAKIPNFYDGKQLPMLPKHM